VAALVATVLPDLPVNLSLLVGKLILFIFAVDDLADERLLSYTSFIEASRTWVALARDGTTSHPFPQDEGLSQLVLELRHELSHLPLFSDWKDLWADRLHWLCEAMAKEYEYGLCYTSLGTEMLPALEPYLHSGIHSVGFPFWGTSVLILLNEPDLHDHLEAINGIILHTGAAIRLYNDMRTYEKEAQEHNINAVLIVENQLAHHQPELSSAERHQQAQQAILDLAQIYAKQSKTLAGQLQSQTGQFVKMIERIIDFHAFFYGASTHHHDYHTISTTDTLSMIQGS
jgi:hypothetical protein